MKLLNRHATEQHKSPGEIPRAKAAILAFFGRLEKAQQKQKGAVIAFDARQAAAFWTSKGNHLEAGDLLLAAAEKLDQDRPRGKNISKEVSSLLSEAIANYEKWENIDGPTVHTQGKIGECSHYLKNHAAHTLHFTHSINLLKKSKESPQAVAEEALPRLKQALFCSLYNNGFSVDNAIAAANALIATARQATPDRAEKELSWADDKLEEYLGSSEARLTGLHPDQLRQKMERSIHISVHSPKRMEIRTMLMEAGDFVLRGDIEKARELYQEATRHAENIGWQFGKQEAEGRLSKIEFTLLLSKNDWPGALAEVRRLSEAQTGGKVEEFRLPGWVADRLYDFAMAQPICDPKTGEQTQILEEISKKAVNALPSLANAHNLKAIEKAIGNLEAEMISGRCARHTDPDISTLLNGHEEEVRLALILSFFVGKEKHAATIKRIEDAFLSLLNTDRGKMYSLTPEELKREVRVHLPHLFQEAW